MGKIKLIGLCVLMLLLCTSCLSYLPEYKKLVMNTYQNKNIDQVIKDWGPPQEIKDGAYTWRRERSRRHEGYWTTETQSVDIYDNKGKVVGYANVDTPYYQNPWTERIYCRTTIYTDANKNIIGVDADGSNMIDHNNGCFKDGNRIKLY